MVDIKTKNSTKKNNKLSAPEISLCSRGLWPILPPPKIANIIVTNEKINSAGGFPCYVFYKYAGAMPPKEFSLTIWSRSWNKTSKGTRQKGTKGVYNNNLSRQLVLLPQNEYERDLMRSYMASNNLFVEQHKEAVLNEKKKQEADAKYIEDLQAKISLVQAEITQIEKQLQEELNAHYLRFYSRKDIQETEEEKIRTTFGKMMCIKTEDLANLENTHPYILADKISLVQADITYTQKQLEEELINLGEKYTKKEQETNNPLDFHTLKHAKKAEEKKINEKYDMMIAAKNIELDKLKASLNKIPFNAPADHKTPAYQVNDMTLKELENEFSFNWGPCPLIYYYTGVNLLWAGISCNCCPRNNIAGVNTIDIAGDINKMVVKTVYILFDELSYTHKVSPLGTYTRCKCGYAFVDD